MRESPSLKLIEIFREKGAIVDYSDPFFPKLPKTRKYQFDISSVELNAENLKSYDLVVLSADHTGYDYKFILENSNIIVDTRNAFAKRGLLDKKIFKS